MENYKEIPDLDHLKAAWKQELEQHAEAESFINQQNLRTMMHQRTHSALARLKRNLLIEIIIAALMLAVVFIWIGKLISPTFWLVVIPITFLGHIALYISLCRQERRSAVDLKESLQISVRHTGWFMRLTRRNPPAAAGTLLFGGLYVIFTHEMSERLTYIFILLVILATIGLFKVIDFYVEKLYGQHYEQLLKHQEGLLE